MHILLSGAHEPPKAVMEPTLCRLSLSDINLPKNHTIEAVFELKTSLKLTPGCALFA